MIRLILSVVWGVALLCVPLLAQLPTISSVTAGANVTPGSTFTLTVFASGTGPFTYQWRRDGANIAGATSSTYSKSSAAAADVGVYSVVVTNANGSVTSRSDLVTLVNAQPPVISKHPSSRRIIPGVNYGTLVVNAISALPMTYQWKKDGVTISGATFFEFSPLESHGTGTYTVTVSNAAGSTTSSPCTVTFAPRPGPTIGSQPLSQSVQAGEYLTLWVGAQSTTNQLTYQWKKDGVSILGATRREYSKNNVVASDAGSYSVVVTDIVGSVTSNAAVIRVLPVPAPVIGEHPASFSLTPSVDYNGLLMVSDIANQRELTYQWRKDGVNIPGATDSAYYVYPVATSAGRYTVAVTNPSGSVTSREAIVTVDTLATRPAIVYTAGGRVVTYWDTVSFIVVAASPAATIQWYKDGVAIVNATGKEYRIESFTTAFIGSYTARVTTSAGTFTSAAIPVELLDYGKAPTLLASPVSATTTLNAGVTFSVLAQGESPLSYQWRKNGVNIADAIGSTFSPLASALGEARYSVVVTNRVGSVTSADAVMTVVPAATSGGAPIIRAQPASQAYLPSWHTLSFEVILEDYTGTTFQWRRDGVAIPGATTFNLSLRGSAIVPGRYSVVATNSLGSVTSEDAVVIALPRTNPPAFTKYPESISAFAGSPLTLTAEATGTASLTYQWRKDGTAIAGATSTSYTIPALSAAHTGTYTLIATDTYGVVSSNAAIVSLRAGVLPFFGSQPQGLTIPSGARTSLAVLVGGDPTPTIQWQLNGVPIPGATQNNYFIPSASSADAGTYTVVASNLAGTVTSASAILIVTPPPLAGTYSGLFENGERWALHVKADGTAVFIALLASRNQAIVARNIVVSSSGAFTFGRARPAAGADAPAFTARYYEGDGFAQIAADGRLTGRVAGLQLNFSGAKLSSGAGPAGHFEAVSIASDLGQIDAIALPDGTIFLLSVDAGAVRGGLGNLTSAGAFSITQPQYSFSGQISSGRLQGSYQAGNVTTSIATPAAASGAERLGNVATRGLAGLGARTLTAGFVIAGSGSKEVLVRAVGPTLGAFGVPGVLTNPRLKLFKAGAPFAENDDWTLGGAGPRIAEAATRVGAFALAAPSADAAVLLRLEPGAYTAEVSGATETAGVALVEVYDATTAQVGGPKLINLSTRGEVGRDGDILIVGVVVSGERAKKLLIRGIGPTLGAFGVDGALADPQLQLYQGSTLLRQNDNWSDSADVASLAEAARSVGAFTLPDGSKDAVLLVYLAPGSYTAQIRGAGSTTGVALVEVYEVP